MLKIVAKISNRVLSLALIAGSLVFPLNGVEAFGGQTAARFLTISVGARAAAMGSAQSATADGALAAFWNPAGLVSNRSGDLMLGHISWYQDVNLEYGAVSFPYKDRYTFNVALLYLGFGKNQGYNLAGDPTGEITAYDFMGSVSGAVQVSDRFSVGLTGKYIRQQLDLVGAGTVAADLGLKYLFEGWSLAATVGNIGGGLKFESVKEDLPANFRLGLSAKPFAREITLAFDLEKQFKGSWSAYTGIEYGFEKKYFVRGGWFRRQAADAQVSSDAYSTGLGLHLGAYRIDYAYTLKGDVLSEDLHRFSLGYSF